MRGRHRSADTGIYPPGTQCGGTSCSDPACPPQRRGRWRRATRCRNRISAKSGPPLDYW